MDETLWDCPRQALLRVRSLIGTCCYMCPADPGEVAPRTANLSPARGQEAHRYRWQGIKVTGNA